MAEGKKERRREPRIQDDAISMKVKVEGADFITRSTNVSSSGIYCKSDTELPLMSRVKVTLILPMKSREKEPTTKIETEGVVVREHPVIIDDRVSHYDVAIFFDSIQPKEREAINYYIAQKG